MLYGGTCLSLKKLTDKHNNELKPCDNSFIPQASKIIRAPVIKRFYTNNEAKKGHSNSDLIFILRHINSFDTVSLLSSTSFPLAAGSSFHQKKTLINPCPAPNSRPTKLATSWWRNSDGVAAKKRQIFFSSWCRRSWKESWYWPYTGQVYINTTPNEG